MRTGHHPAFLPGLLVPFTLAACGHASAPIGATPTESTPVAAATSTASASDLAAANAAPAASTPPGWLDYADPAGRYAARFPVAPEIESRKTARSSTESATAIADHRLFAVSWLTLHISTPTTCDQVAHVHLTANASAFECEGSEEKPVTVDGVPGAEITLACADGMHGRWRALCLAHPADPLTFDVAWIQAVDRNEVFDRKLADGFLADVKLKKSR